MSAQAQVAIDTDRLDEAVVAELGAVCAGAAAEVVLWRDLPASQPLVVVGALRRGERQIPAPLLEAANTAGAAVLLLSDDPLVRPVVSVHGGRVTLVSPATSRARLRGTLRMLLAHHGRFSRERLLAQAWVATFGRGDACAPALYHDGAGALTAVFPFDPGWSGAEPLSFEAHRVVDPAQGLDEDERRRQLRELFGRVAGMVHLSRTAAQWSLYWPSATAPLYLCSPQRLPAICNLASQADTHVLHLAASPGDVVIALAPASPASVAGPATATGVHDDRRLAIGDGGAAFLEELEASPGATPSGIIVEIR